MARMIGKVKKMWYGQCKYGCCYMRSSKTATKRAEESLALHEAEEELYDERDEKHARGICFDPKTKMYGCDSCYDGDDYNPPEDLDGVPNVLYNGKEPPKYDFSSL